MNNSQVAHAWAHGRSGKGSHLESDGTTLTSYWTPIAARIDGVIYISADSMSPSTSKHLSYARQAVNHERSSIFYTHAFQHSHRPTLTHAGMLQPEAEYIIRTLERALAATRTRQTTKTAAIEDYMQTRAQLLELAARYNVTLPELPAIESTPEAIAAYQEEKRQAEEKREAARVKAAKKQQKLDKQQLDTWLTTGAGSYPRSFYTRGQDQITIKGDKVITSQGAECPLDHVKKALWFYEGRRIQTGSLPKNKHPFNPYHTNGHKIHLGIFVLDSIDEAGTVYAGCHTFTAAEIRRFINQWKEVLGL